MKKYIINILIVILALFAFTSDFNNPKNINNFLKPIVYLIMNIKNGNLFDNKHLSNNGIKINTSIFRWVYSINRFGDRIHFLGDVISVNNNKNVYQEADLVLFGKNISKNDFIDKYVKPRNSKCFKLTKNKTIHNKYLTIETICRLNNGYELLYYDIPDKKVSIEFYPYLNNKENRLLFDNLIENIEIK